MNFMEFELSIWMNKYRRVREIGRILKQESEGVIFLGDTERYKLRVEQDGLLSEQSQYLNSCGYPHPPILWRYNLRDESTWASSNKFSYPHLLKHLN